MAFVEMMIPFFSRQTFEVSSVYFQENVSGWGLDEVLWPKRIGKQHMMVLDSLAVGHYRPLQDRFQKLENGYTLEEERQMVISNHCTPMQQCARLLRFIWARFNVWVYSLLKLIPGFSVVHAVKKSWTED